MNLVLFIISLFWITRISLNVLSYVHLWWVKEYRFDRMWIHFHTPQGRKIFVIPWHKPHVSPRSIFLIAVSLISLLGLFFFLPLQIIFRLILIDFLTFPIVSLSVLITRLPVLIYHQIVIALAISKLNKHKKMLVVGITGSFGKTSTKEFLATILETKYKVLKTDASKNSPIGIAEVILKNLRDEHEVFVVEMAAYKRGEIEYMTKMVKPQVGIVTAINSQHQDLFGSIETTMKAKYELIDGLVDDQIAIFNADNRFVVEMSEWAKKLNKKVLYYSIGNTSLKEKNIFLAKKIESDIKSGISFEINYKNFKQKINANLIGNHQASNLLAATAAAYSLGLSFEQIAKGISQIKPLPKTIQPVSGIKGSLFINDTFNNNPDAARAAIDVLAKAKTRKFLVFQPMIELGKYADVSHADVGEHAAKVCDEIILTNQNFFESFKNGVDKANKKVSLQVLPPIEAANYLKNIIKSGDTVLFIGKTKAKIIGWSNCCNIQKFPGNSSSF